jgi:hypothetical protein
MMSRSTIILFLKGFSIFCYPFFLIITGFGFVRCGAKVENFIVGLVTKYPGSIKKVLMQRFPRAFRNIFLCPKFFSNNSVYDYPHNAVSELIYCCVECRLVRYRKDAIHLSIIWLSFRSTTVILSNDGI